MVVCGTKSARGSQGGPATTPLLTGSRRIRRTGGQQMENAADHQTGGVDSDARFVDLSEADISEMFSPEDDGVLAVAARKSMRSHHAESEPLAAHGSYLDPPAPSDGSGEPATVNP
jgi:hypothetical protein